MRPTEVYLLFFFTKKGNGLIEERYEICLYRFTVLAEAGDEGFCQRADIFICLFVDYALRKSG